MDPYIHIQTIDRQIGAARPLVGQPLASDREESTVFHICYRASSLVHGRISVLDQVGRWKICRMAMGGLVSQSASAEDGGEVLLPGRAVDRRHKIDRSRLVLQGIG